MGIESNTKTSIKELVTGGKKITSLAYQGMLFQGGGGGGIVPYNVQNMRILYGINSISIKWGDPDDTYDHDQHLYCKWAGTKLIYREDNQFPLNAEDGIEVLDNKEKDAYKNDYFKIENLELDKPYAFALIPYSEDGGYNVNEYNMVVATPNVGNFADVSDEELAEILDAHYRGLIDISDYWHVGDTRLIHVNEIDNGFRGIPNKDDERYSEYGYIENHVAQDMVFTIIGINHDTLAEPIGIRDKAAITIQSRECMGDGSQPANYGILEFGTQWQDNPEYEGDTSWNFAPRRGWLNSIFISALPEGIQPSVKTVIKKTLPSSGIGAIIETEDRAFLLSGSEVGFKNEMGTFSYYAGENGLEGEKYEYFSDDENIGNVIHPNLPRCKRPNANGVPYIYPDGIYMADGEWWLRSPSTYPGERFGLLVDKDGGPTRAQLYIGGGIAPALCL